MLKFFTIYNNEVRLDPSNFNEVRQVHKLCNFLNGASIDSSIIDGVLVIKHCILRMSDVTNEYYANPDKKVHSIDIFCYCFYFDANVTFPSINLSIQTQHVHIQDDRKVSLKGQDGEEIVPAKAENGFESGSNGYNGQPGSPGKPGGNFNLKFKHGTSSGNLSIDVSGGDGSNGQDGGSGQKGEDGKDGNLDLVKERKEECLVSRTMRGLVDRSNGGKVIHALKTVGTVNGQFVEIYRSKGTAGQKGGDRGRPGIGGKGARKGRVSISDNSPIFLITAEKGNNGKNGNFGKSGSDGKPGRD